jgi:hypothetical protein
LLVAFIIPHSFLVPAWYAETIRNVRNRPGVKIVFLLTMHPSTQPSLPIPLRIFQKLEDWWLGPANDAQKTVGLKDLVENSYTLEEKNPFHLDPDKLSDLKQLNTDLIYSIDYRFGMPENLSSASRYGLWYPVTGNAPIPGFWEVMDHHPVSASGLVCQKNDQARMVYSGTTSTVPFSIRNNSNSLSWKMSGYLPLRLDQLIQQSESFFAFYPELYQPGPQRTLPASPVVAWMLLENFSRYLWWKFLPRETKRFSLFYSNSSFTIDDHNEISFKPIPLPNGFFHADPFHIEKDGRHYLFFEEYDLSKKKAHISLMVMGPNNTWSKPEQVLEEDDHLSYPFVFLHEGNFYMLPETAAARRLTIYKARNFPYEWESVMNLQEGKELLDATLVFDQDRWWMFANSRTHPFVSTNDQLFLFSSKELLSEEWIPHPCNPIVTHAGNCRPAGRIFRQNGKLYRPSQDNASFQYGSGLVFNEIQELSETVYKERLAGRLDHDAAGLQACHHIDLSGSVVLVDGIAK